MGPVTLHLFGLLVATGILAGIWLVYRRAREYRISEEEMSGAIAWDLGAGFFGAHVFEILFYTPERITNEGPFILLKFWDGISSYGGFFGAVLGLTYYFHRLKKPWLVHADILLQGLVVGWVFGRLGCTLAHDHIGILTDFFLAFKYPDGARHNLGFYEFLLTLFVLLPTCVLLNKRHLPGLCLAVVSMIYAPVRFGLDFLRATDKANSDIRYFGLTPAQYACIGVFIYGLFLLRRVLKTKPIF